MRKIAIVICLLVIALLLAKIAGDKTEKKEKIFLTELN